MSDIPPEWREMDQSERMYSLYAELRLLREQLTEATDDGTRGFECTRCDWSGNEKDRAVDHALDTHKTPPDLVDQVIREVVE
jgi:hypothetical protein